MTAKDKTQSTAIGQELTILESLSHPELKSQWTEAFGTTPPKGLSRRLMIYALAYDLQEQNSGGLKPAVRQKLRLIASPNSSKTATEAPQLTPGTRLMREWRGTVHVVDLTEDGLVWNGRTYNSLSAIARAVTGTRWSGNRFFGLRKRSDVIAARTPSTRADHHEGAEDFVPSSDESRCSNGEDPSLRPKDTGPKSDAFQPPESINADSDASRHTDNVNAEHTARLADNSKHAPSRVCSKLEPESVS